jgi:hypothetical protein
MAEVVCQVDRGHAAMAELPLDHVAASHRAGQPFG